VVAFIGEGNPLTAIRRQVTVAIRCDRCGLTIDRRHGTPDGTDIRTSLDFVRNYGSAGQPVWARVKPPEHWVDGNWENGCMDFCPTCYDQANDERLDRQRAYR
jgi:hypothetical protein